MHGGGGDVDESLARPGSPIMAGAAYFAIVFASGFVLGTVRTLVVLDRPGGGRLLGVLIELPVMLVVSWWACCYLVRRMSVGRAARPRLVMGGVAFTLLMGAELLVGMLLFGRTIQEHFALYRDASYAIGLAAQLTFGLMPLLELRRSR
jgi:hypothetical protein